MLALHLTDPADIADGVFSGVRLEPTAGNLATQGTPALVADIDPTQGTAQLPQDAGTLGGTWTLLGGGFFGPVLWSEYQATQTTNGTLTIHTTTAYAIDVLYVYSASGAIGHVTVDSQPRRAFNTATTQTLPYRIYLDGKPHTIVITNEGDAVLGAQLVTGPTDSGGTAGLAAALGVVRNGQPVTGDTWTVAAESGTAVGVYHAPDVAAPSSAPTGTPSGTGGSVPAATHTYEVTYVNPTGETAAGTASSGVVTTGSTSSVALASIPIGPAGTTARKVYRSDGGAYGLVLTISDNTTTTGTDTAASLGAAPPSSGTMLTFVGSLSTGQTSDALIGGVTLSLVAGSWDATSKATLTTVTPSLGLSQIVTYAALAPVATYTSPVFDAGQFATQWPLMQVTQDLGATAPTVQIGVGDSSQPDSTWTWQTLTALAVADPDGNPWQRVSYAGPDTRGRYAQVIGTLPTNAFGWVSDLWLFSWVPEVDPFLANLPHQVYAGLTVTRPVLAALAALWATLDRQAADLTDGANITTAAGSYLTGYGTQFSLPRLPGEADAPYRSRLSAFLQGRANGGSQPFLTTVLSGAFGCPVAVSPYARSLGGFVLGQTALGTQGLGQSATGFWRWCARIPIDQLQIPPETVATIVEELRPVGSVASVLYV